jgi:hypothetical protein
MNFSQIILRPLIVVPLWINRDIQRNQFWANSLKVSKNLLISGQLFFANAIITLLSDGN